LLKTNVSICRTPRSAHHHEPPHSGIQALGIDSYRLNPRHQRQPCRGSTYTDELVHVMRDAMLHPLTNTSAVACTWIISITSVAVLPLASSSMLYQPSTIPRDYWVPHTKQGPVLDSSPHAADLRTQHENFPKECAQDSCK